MYGTGESGTDFRVNMEAGGSEEVPESETPCGPTRPLDRNKALSGLATGGQDTEGEYDRIEDFFASGRRED